MPLLAWNVFENPVYDSRSPWRFCLSERFELSQAEFNTFDIGGFGDGKLEIPLTPKTANGVIEEALSYWLMKRVTATDGAGLTAWEGFIAEIEVVRGYHTYTLSIDPFFNRVFVEYQWSGGSCPSGSTCYGRMQRNETDVDSTANTQTRWGIKEAWLDAGSGVITSTQAQNLADESLLEVMTATNWSLSLGSGAEPQPPKITLTLWGYYATLSFRKSNLPYPGVSGIREPSAILKNVLTVGSKAPFLDTDGLTFPNMASTGRLVQFNTGGSIMTLQEYVEGLISGGDKNGRFEFFQILEGRKPWMFSRSSAPRYFSRSDSSRVWNSTHGVIPAYMVRAGGHVLAEDLPEALSNKSDVAQRPRASLITETNYDALNDVLSISPPDRLKSPEQLMASAQRRARRQLR